MIMEWQQATTSLYFAGAYKYIRMFDVTKECRVVDIPTGSDAYVTSLSNDAQASPLVLTSCSDGYVRVYDSRQAATSRWAYLQQNLIYLF